MTGLPTLNQVLEWINEDGAAGDESMLMEALRASQKRSEGSKLRSFRVGDVVQFNSSARPQYLYRDGVRATITKINQTRVVLRIHGDAGRFSGDRDVRCPVAIIDKVVD